MEGGGEAAGPSHSNASGKGRKEGVGEGKAGEAKKARIRPPRAKGGGGAGGSKKEGDGKATSSNNVAKADKGNDGKASAEAIKAAKKRAKRNKKNKKRKKEEREARQRDEVTPKSKLKVVIRRLPPNLPEDIFWKSIRPWVKRATDEEEGERGSQPAPDQAGPQTGETSVLAKTAPVSAEEAIAIVEQAYYVAGKLKDGTKHGIQADAQATPHTMSRAYLRFRTLEELVHFHRHFDGHLYRDAKGVEHRAVVEFAPFQRMPGDGIGRRRKVDPLHATIDKDADYLQFIQTLEQADAEASQEHGQGQAERTEAQLMAHMTALADTQEAQKLAKSTPLLEHLRAQRAAKKEALALKQARKKEANKTGSAKQGKAAKQASTGDSTVPTAPKAMLAKAERANKGGKKGKKMADSGTDKQGQEGQKALPKEAKQSKPKRAKKEAGTKPSEKAGKDGGGAPAVKMAVLQRDGPSAAAQSSAGTAEARPDNGQQPSKKAARPPRARKGPPKNPNADAERGKDRPGVKVPGG